MHRDYPLLYQRTEPKFGKDGTSLVARLFVHHPALFARIKKLDIATPAAKPHLARELLARLGRHGCPESTLQELRTLIRSRLGGSVFDWFRPEAPAPPPAGPDDPALRPDRRLDAPPPQRSLPPEVPPPPDLWRPNPE